MATPANPPTPSPAPDAAANISELTALLLEVLRNVNREVETTLESESQATTTRELEGHAQTAVVHFREISLSLQTPADGSASPSPPSAGTIGATGTIARAGTAAPPARSR